MAYHQPENPLVSLATDYHFDLHRQGEADKGRFKRRIADAVRKNLPDIISRQNIISADGNKEVRVPVYDVDIPRFRHAQSSEGQGGAGQGSGQPGDVVGQVPGEGEGGPGQGKKAGDTPGVDYIEVGYKIDELAELMFADCGLPFIRPTARQQVPSEAVKFSDIRKKGPMSNLDKRRTIRENVLRNALDGNPGFYGISEDDLRFKTWEPTTIPQTSAVMFAMRDVSGSMGEFEKYISRALFFWMVKFLRTKYQQVDVVFITHHAEAKEVDEQTFFSLGESGGTKASSAYQLATDIMQIRYPSALWNRYPVHISDGDNWGDADDTRCMGLVTNMLEKENCGAFGYFEIAEGGRGWTSTLMSTFTQYPNPRLITSVICKREDVYPALRNYFDSNKQEVMV